MSSSPSLGRGSPALLIRHCFRTGLRPVGLAASPVFDPTWWLKAVLGGLLVAAGVSALPAMPGTSWGLVCPGTRFLTIFAACRVGSSARCVEPTASVARIFCRKGVGVTLG